MENASALVGAFPSSPPGWRPGHRARRRSSSAAPKSRSRVGSYRERRRRRFSFGRIL